MMVSVTNTKHTTTEVRKMMDQRFRQVESWYKCERAYNLDAAELTRLDRRNGRESIFSKLTGFFRTV